MSFVQDNDNPSAPSGFIGTEPPSQAAAGTVDPQTGLKNPDAGDVLARMEVETVQDNENPSNPAGFIGDEPQAGLPPSATAPNLQPVNVSEEHN